MDNEKDDVPHTYTNSEGQEIPSVTHIISIIKKKNITSWANYLGFKHISVKNFINDKAILGSLVHERIECFFQGTEAKPYFDQRTSNEVNKRFEIFKTWYECAKPVPIWQEKEFTNNRYGGKLDLLCKMYDDKIVLLDFKTSKAVRSSHFLQLGGYLNLIQDCEPEMYKKIDLCQIVAITDRKVIQEVRPIELMKKYQDAFNDAYELYVKWDKILREEWNDSLRDLGIL